MRRINTIKRGLRDTGIILLMTLLYAVLLEFILRLVLSWPTISVAYEVHSKYLHVLRPGILSAYTRTEGMGGEEVVWRVNARGFRGREFPREKTQPRIVIYGDSNIHANFTPLQQTLPVQLETLLASEYGRHVEVINVGVTGYGPDQVALRLEDELDRLQPDLVIVNLFADNDFGDLIRNKIYRLDAKNRLILRPYRLHKAITRQFLLDRIQTFYLVRAANRLATQPKQWLTDLYKTHVFEDRMAYLKYEIRNRTMEYESYQRNDVIDYSMFSDFYDYDLALEPDSPSAQYKRALIAAVITRIGEIVRAYGQARLLFMIQPSSRDVSTNLPENLQTFAAHFPKYLPSGRTDFLQQVVTQQQLPSLNLYPLFVEYGADQLYFKQDDDHWNETGQRLVARHLSDTIVANGLLEMDGSP